MDRDSITQTGARAPGVERNTARTEVPARPIVPDTEQGNPDGGRKHEGRWQTRTRGRPHLIFRPLSRTGENPPYGILGEAMETSASFEARSAPLSYPTAKERPYGSVRGVPCNRYPYRDIYYVQSWNVYENKRNMDKITAKNSDIYGNSTWILQKNSEFDGQFTLIDTCRAGFRQLFAAKILRQSRAGRDAYSVSKARGDPIALSRRPATEPSKLDLDRSICNAARKLSGVSYQ